MSYSVKNEGFQCITGENGHVISVIPKPFQFIVDYGDYWLLIYYRDEKTNKYNWEPPVRVYNKFITNLNVIHEKTFGYEVSVNKQDLNSIINEMAFENIFIDNTIKETKNKKRYLYLLIISAIISIIILIKWTTDVSDIFLIFPLVILILGASQLNKL